MHDNNKHSDEQTKKMTTIYSFQVIYVVATFPYILITILLVFSCTLEGASKGIEYYIKPDIDRLADAEVRLTIFSDVFRNTNVHGHLI